MKVSLDRIYAGAVYDALRSLGLPDGEFVLSRAVKPLDLDSQVMGPAYTCRGARVPSGGYAQADRARLEMWARIEAGQVVVLQADDDYCAHSGDITSLVYHQLGAAGFVTDGLVRDSRAIREIGLPCFCAGATPIDALEYWAIIEFERPIALAGVLDDVPVEPGDWVYGDADGVLRIPGEKLSDFHNALERSLEKEDEIRWWIAEARGPDRVTAAARQAYEHFGRW